MLNRIKELREARDWSMDRLAAAAIPPTTSSTISKLEKGIIQLDVEWIERIAAGLGVDPVAIIDDRSFDGWLPVRDDVEEVMPGLGDPLGKLLIGDESRLWRVKTNVLDETGVAAGELILTGPVNGALHTGDTVVATVSGSAGEVTVLRQYLGPNQLVSNSRASHCQPLSVRSEGITPQGVVQHHIRSVRRQ